MRREEPLWQTTDPFLLRFIGRHIPLFLFLVLAVAGMMAVYFSFSPASPENVATTEISRGTGILSAPIFKPLASRLVTQRFTQTTPPVRIGIISGHMNNDSGAVCEDGLTEAQVNLDIALRAANRLREQGIPVTILAEFDPRLRGFAGDALIAIHADSCVYVNGQATGFKMSPSSVSESSVLYQCMESAYSAATSLPFHANTITPDMTDYHAFHEISPGVPAIIIETGFMYLDRELLTTYANTPAAGIADGILCFLGATE
jgi:N-acetylmuramoyl-L-alanine amidase